MSVSLLRLRARASTHVNRLATRSLSTSAVLRQTKDNGRPTFGFKDAPAPPRLPKEEQDIFEELQRRSTGAFSTPQVNQSPQSDSQPTINAKGNGEELHPDVPKGLKPEFEGEKNPKTGEVGGPKNEPLRWGAGGDWSYGGRVTDF
ncbi:Succinate dehydrogenase assembly factor 4 [Penicillium diatomitis]|uniref:Succinate dehydrogenase assembly factor 4, mitochondrial n=1 Tax=Penicillium diatomitis TaxID=2819901 RepID=A0A9X0BTY4_9EURO|nr:Succinate dehydrogenase assembly factor 4 [Penicillium diatomitis]KAJ5484148.1 Succinate dehydrogenase assembly factor 4 [Penicillium diatomitis]